MPRYQVLTLSFIDGKLYNEGDEVDFNGVPGSNLKPVDGAAQKAAKAVPPDPVASLVSQVRLNASIRGAKPDEANASDLQTVLASMNPQPTATVVEEASVVLGLKQASALV